MMDEKQIESLKRRYGSRIADAPKRRRGPERMAVMKGGKRLFLCDPGDGDKSGGRLYAAPDHQPVYCAFRW